MNYHYFLKNFLQQQSLWLFSQSTYRLTFFHNLFVYLVPHQIARALLDAMLVGHLLTGKQLTSLEYIIAFDAVVRKNSTMNRQKRKRKRS